MKREIKFTLLTVTLFTLIACNQNNSNSEATKEIDAKKEIANTPNGQVLTQKQQEAMSPDDVIKILKEGNVQFTNNDLTSRNHSKQIRNSTNAQFPKAIILSCVDSRVPVEDVFDRGIGDLFVARVAGNFVNEDILGSMEYACKVAGSKLILIMGHEHCGAIKATIDDVKMGNITPMLEKIKPALENVEYEGERNTKNKEFVHMVCESNVRNTIEQIKLNSPILKLMAENGEIKIVGALYDMDNGKVDFIE